MKKKLILRTFGNNRSGYDGLLNHGSTLEDFNPQPFFIKNE